MQQNDGLIDGWSCPAASSFAIAAVWVLISPGSPATASSPACSSPLMNSAGACPRPTAASSPSTASVVKAARRGVGGQL